MSTQPRRAQRRSRADTNDARRRAWRAVFETSRAVEALLDTSLQLHAGLDMVSYDALLHTFEAGARGVRMTDLAERIVLSKSGLTTLVDRLEARGLLRRAPDPDDRRALRIMLTEVGLTTFRRAARIHVADIETYFANHLDDKDAIIVAEALERVHGAIRAKANGTPQSQP